ncbi:hypothetical protein AB1Y20_015321 [Prymnesium parvum]|uniref:Uncharacterized protein n=1 Tax=Prymnesium parvum TaxID=97485 RepID=A0AB34K072_PRYPA
MAAGCALPLLLSSPLSQPFWLKRQQEKSAWIAELHRRGQHFDIGDAACARHHSSARCAAPRRRPRPPTCARPAANATNVLAARASRASPAEPRLFLRLLRKLEAGEAVTILALGSSVVGAHAGCTRPLPHLARCACPKCCGSRCGRWGGGGWAVRLLEWVNASWPHAEHTLYNLGEPGGDFLPSLLACPASYLTFDFDLVLLDFFTAYHAGKHALIYEQAVRSLLGGARSHRLGPPSVILVNFFEFADRHHPKSTFDTFLSQFVEAQRSLARDTALHPAAAVESVLNMWHFDDTPTLAAALRLLRAWARRKDRALEQTDVWRNFFRDAEVRVLSRHYGLPAVSLAAAYGREFELHEHGVHLHDFACYDGLHPNHHARAEQMIAAPLIGVLQRGLAAARRLGAPSAYALPAALQRLPPRSGKLCFDFDAEGWSMLTGEKPTNRKVHEQSMLQTAALAHVSRRDGWAFVQYEPASNTPFKPGIVAHRAGAVLQLQLDTSATLQPKVALQYLESFSGMGVVSGSCSGCECEPFTVDARGTIAHQSTNQWHEVDVTQHPACELTLRVLNTSAPTKFKLVRLIITGGDEETSTAPPSERRPAQRRPMRTAPLGWHMAECNKPSSCAPLQRLAARAREREAADAAAAALNGDTDARAHERGRVAALALLHATRQALRMRLAEPAWPRAPFLMFACPRVDSGERRSTPVLPAEDAGLAL